MRARPSRLALVGVAVVTLAGCGNPPASPRASTAAAATPTAAPGASAAAPTTTAPNPMTAALNPASTTGSPGPTAVTGAIAGAADADAPAEEAKYAAKGRRDPFAPLEVQHGVNGPSVSTAKLRGIVSGSTGPLALIDTAEGVGYILKRGDTLVDGRLVDINQDSVVFAVASKPGGAAASNRVTLRLPQD